MKILTKLHTRLGDFWWYSLMLFCACRAADLLNAFVGLWLVPKYVDPSELGAVMPLTQFANFLAIPVAAFANTFRNELTRLSINKEFGKLKTLMRGVFAATAVFLFLAILLCILLLNLWTIGHSMRPLRKLLRWLDRYRVGEDNRPLDNPTKIYEFRKLNEVVKESIERTEVAYEQQKMFIGNASHEMQTPLAICSSRLEMLLEDPSLTERQMEEIVKTRQTLEQLSRMNRSLLLLTKIDNGQFADVADVNFTESIQRLLPDYEMVYASKNIRLQTELQGDFIVRMDESLAQTLLSNLLKNAFVHNHEGGEITIKATADSLLFENTGAPESLNRDYIFERFYHSSDNRQSLGLGLAVVKAICQRYGLRIDYAFNNGKHAFTIVKN